MSLNEVSLNIIAGIINPLDFNLKSPDQCGPTLGGGADDMLGEVRSSY